MTNAEAWFNIALRPWKPEGSLGRTAQDGHLDSHTAPKLCTLLYTRFPYLMPSETTQAPHTLNFTSAVGSQSAACTPVYELRAVGGILLFCVPLPRIQLNGADCRMKTVNARVSSV